VRAPAKTQPFDACVGVACGGKASRAAARRAGAQSPASRAIEVAASGIFKDGENFQRKLRWLTTSELLDAADKGWQVAPDATRKEKEQGQMLAMTQLMSHLASAFSVFSLAFLAVPLAVRVGRSETFVNATIALGVALTYYLLTSLAAYVKDPDLRPDLLIWLPNVVVVVLAWTLLRRASRH
jgi:lipopolysaccharide export system permease protein